MVEQSEVRITPFPLFIHLLLDEYYDGAEWIDIVLHPVALLVEIAVK